MSEWKTIESAPRDGTYILLFQKYLPDEPFIGCFDGHKWTVDKRSLQSSYGTIEDYIDLQSSITHWMPLPSSPETKP